MIAFAGHCCNSITFIHQFIFLFRMYVTHCKWDRNIQICSLTLKRCDCCCCQLPGMSCVFVCRKRQNEDKKKHNEINNQFKIQTCNDDDSRWDDSSKTIFSSFSVFLLQCLHAQCTLYWTLHTLHIFDQDPKNIVVQMVDSFFIVCVQALFSSIFPLSLSFSLFVFHFLLVAFVGEMSSAYDVLETWNANTTIGNCKNWTHFCKLQIASLFGQECSMDKTNGKINRKRKWQKTRINVFLIIVCQWYRTNANIQSDKMLFV